MKDVLLGTQEPVKVSVDAIGTITMADMDFTIKYFSKVYGYAVTVPKSECVKVDENTYEIVVDTQRIGVGMLNVIVDLAIPYSNAPSGLIKKLLYLPSNIRIVSPSEL